jgi:hypothetical protein
MNLVTVKQISERLGVDYATAKAIIVLGQKQGIILERGKLKNLSGVGRASTLYQVPQELVVDLSKVGEDVPAETKADVPVANDVSNQLETVAEAA